MYTPMLIMDCIFCFFFCLLLFFLYEWRIPKKYALLFFCCLPFLCCICYLGNENRWPDPITAKVLFLLLPPLIAAFALAKNRDARFWFTYWSLRMLVVAIDLLSNVFAWIFADHAVGLLSAAFLLCLGAFCLLFCFRTRYLKILQLSNAHWGLNSAVSIFLYCMMCMMYKYPMPLDRRPEYIPTLLFFCIFTTLIYGLIFTTIHRIPYQREIQKLQTQLQREKRYHALAFLDELTHLGNRRAFEEILEEKRALKQTFCYVVLDINHFKKINDTYGHLYGDRVLCQIANMLLEMQQDIFKSYRIGGDEFALISITQDNGKIRLFLESLQKQSTTYNFAIGYDWISDYQKDSISALLLRADQKMYRHKALMKQCN